MLSSPAANLLRNYGTITANVGGSAIDAVSLSGDNTVENFGTVTGLAANSGARAFQLALKLYF